MAKPGIDKKIGYGQKSWTWTEKWDRKVRQKSWTEKLDRKVRQKSSFQSGKYIKRKEELTEVIRDSV